VAEPNIAEDIRRAAESAVLEAGEPDWRSQIRIAVEAAAPLIVAAFLDDLAAYYQADIFTPDGTSRDAISGTALRTVLSAQAKALRGETA
jgi:hypothetical protein